MLVTKQLPVAIDFHYILSLQLLATVWLPIFLKLSFLRVKYPFKNFSKAKINHVTYMTETTL